MKYYTTKDVIDKHGFTHDFINKCLNKMRPVFESHISRGNKNARLFDSEALNIFDMIAQKKNDGQSISEIEAYVLQSLKKATTGNNYQEKDITTPQDDIVLVMKKHHEEVVRLHEVIRNMEMEKLTLESSVKLLTDGKSPEQVKQEWIEEQKRLIRIQEKIKQLQALSITQWIRRRKLLKELAELTGPGQ